MLNHGVADDNVHYQHTALLTKELEQRDVQFVQHSYPDENHSLRGVSRWCTYLCNLYDLVSCFFFIDFYTTPWTTSGEIVSCCRNVEIKVELESVEICDLCSSVYCHIVSMTDM